MDRILVTGSAGFIGFHLIEKLSKLNVEIDGVDIINDYYDVNLKYDRLAQSGIGRNDISKDKWVISTVHKNYRFKQMDLTEKEAVDSLFSEKKYSQIIHLAAQPGVRYSIQNPNAYIMANLVAFAYIIESAKNFKVDKFIYASSSSVYGESDKVPFSEDDRVDKPISLYAATKKSNELIAYTYWHLFKLKTIGLRFFTVYGPWGRPDMAPMIFAKAAQSGKEINLFNNGNQQRDFTFIDDIIEGILMCITKPVNSGGKIYNIGKGSPESLMKFVDALGTSMNIELKTRKVAAQMGDVSRTYADIDSLKNELGYSPKVNMAEGVKRFVNWYIDYHTKSGKKSSKE